MDDYGNEQIDLGVELYRIMGAEGLRGHPSYESAKAFENHRERMADRWRGMRDEDHDHYELTAEKIATTSPVAIAVICTTHEYADRFRRLLCEDFAWSRALASYLESTSGRTRVWLVTESRLHGSRGLQGLKLDYVIPHRWVEWRIMMEHVYPALASTGAKLLY